MREWLSRDAWVAAVAKGEAPEAGLRKAYIAEVEKAPADDAGPTAQRPTYRFTISTGTPDRERDVIAVDGWKLKHYRANPVVLWAHDYRTPPIGQAVELPKVRDGKLVSGVRFDSDVHDLARVVEQLVERGTLRATSVGFAPLKHQLNDERRGYDFLEQELLEWSIVPVPANPEALAEAKAAGVDLAPVRLWAVRALEDDGGPGFWVSRATLEATWRATRPDATISLAAPKPDCPMGEQCPMRHDGKAVPGNASAERADEGDAWAAPSLKDFTDKAWGDLSAAERTRIAKHYAWAKSLPPATFGDLKLPHHRASDGKVVWRGVAAAMAALMGGRGGVDLPTSERRAVYGHLAAHYRAFGKEPPEYRAAADGLDEATLDGEVRFFLDEDDQRPAVDDLAIEPAALRAVLAELVAEGVTTTLCRLTGRVD